MANSQAIRAGRAFVELFANDKRLVRGLKAASAKLKAWGAGVTAMGRKVFAGGLALAAPLAAATKTFAAMGDTVAKMSLRTGISAESLSELGFAAEQSGSDLQTLEKGVRTMQRSINDAGRGLSTQVDALEDLGLKYEDLADLSPDQQFKLFADHLSRIEDPSKRAALAMMLLGRAGTQLLPLMQDGAAGIEALQKQARELGLTISTEDANAAAALTDAMNILWRVFKQGVFVIGSALGPLLKEFAERVAGVIKRVSDWIKQNKNLIVTIFKVAAAMPARAEDARTTSFHLNSPKNNPALDTLHATPSENVSFNAFVPAILRETGLLLIGCQESLDQDRDTRSTSLLFLPLSHSLLHSYIQGVTRRDLFFLAPHMLPNLKSYSESQPETADHPSSLETRSVLLFDCCIYVSSPTCEFQRGTRKGTFLPVGNDRY